MLKLLYTLYTNGGSLSTNTLYTRARMSNNYSKVLLLRAERMGYITRKKVPMPKGKRGNDMIINTLTPKGHELLQKLGVVA